MKYTNSPSTEEIQSMKDKNGAKEAAYAASQAKQAQSAEDKRVKTLQG
jgi:hypothetical protein